MKPLTQRDKLDLIDCLESVMDVTSYRELYVESKRLIKKLKDSFPKSKKKRAT